MKKETYVYVIFESGKEFIGTLCLNLFTGKLVFDNDSSCSSVNEEQIRYIKFLTKEQVEEHFAAQ